MFICCYFSLLSDLFLLLHKAHKSISSPLSPFFSPLVLQSLLPFCALAFHVRSTLIYLCQFLFSFSYVCLCNRLCFMIFSYDSHLSGVICVSCCIFCHTLGGSVVLSNTDAVSLLLWAAAIAARSTCSLPVPAGPLPIPAWLGGQALISCIKNNLQVLLSATCTWRISSLKDVQAGKSRFG